MKKTIWKFPLSIGDISIILLPKGAEILTIQVQSNTPCIWALVDPAAKKEKRHFEMFGTGHPVNCDMGISRKYINTFQLHGGSLVLHLFERTD